MLKRFLLGLVLLDLVALNAWIGYGLWNRKGAVTLNQSEVNTIDRCGLDCQDYIKDTVASLMDKSDAVNRPTPVPDLTPTPTRRPVSAQTATASTKVRRVTYLTIPGNGSTLANDWTTLPATEFLFDVGDYPGLVEIYFEANMKLFNGNGIGYVRLLDVTHGIGVQGSEAQTSSQSDVIVSSGKVTFWSGKNTIRIQAKSLTADTTVFNWGRLRIVTEN